MPKKYIDNLKEGLKLEDGELYEEIVDNVRAKPFSAETVMEISKRFVESLKTRPISIHKYKAPMIEFAKTISLWNEASGTYENIQNFTDNQVEYLFGDEPKFWKRKDGQTTAKLIEVLYLLDRCDNKKILLVSDVISDSMHKIRILCDMIKHSSGIKLDKYKMGKVKIINIDTKSKVEISSKRSDLFNVIGRYQPDVIIYDTHV